MFSSIDRYRPSGFTCLVLIIVGSLWVTAEMGNRSAEARTRAAELSQPIGIVVETELPIYMVSAPPAESETL